MSLWNLLQSNPLYLIASTVFACLFVFMIVWFLMSRANQNSKFVLQTQHEQLVQNLQYKTELQEQKISQLKASMEQQRDEFANYQNQYQKQLSVYQSKLYENEHKLGESAQQSIQLDEAKKLNASLKNHIEKMQAAYAALQAQHEAAQASVAQERKGFDEKFALLESAEVKLNTQFENLANRIFEQKSETFSKNSANGMNQLLSPLKQQIDDFKRQMSEQYTREGQERASLKTEILGLKELNKQITEEAAALTNALKGDNKQQGNWGELVLERVLSESGLREGHEYEVQMSTNNEEGKRFQPDIVVHLPNDKDIIIDSKVSLVAHEKAVNATDDETRKRALKEHVNSIKGHIKGLSIKDYQKLSGVTSLDYVLMFIPIESAFINAVEEDPQLIKLALDNQIMLVSPTNLLVALRTINNIWQYEYQDQNAQKIADKASRMYDKFANFVSDMEKIGKNMDTLKNTYEGAMNKLSTGKGSLIKQAQDFKALGVSATKEIDSKYHSGDESLKTVPSSSRVSISSASKSMDSKSAASITPKDEMFGDMPKLRVTATINKTKASEAEGYEGKQN